MVSRRDSGGVLACGLAAVVLWGLAPVATRALVAEAAPLPVLVLRQLLAACVLLPWALPMLRRIDSRALGRLVIAGLLVMVGYNLPVMVGLQWLPASTAGLLLAIEPLWVLLIGRVVLAERLTFRIWSGSVISLVGVAALAGPAALSPVNGSRTLAGAVLVILGTAAFGGYTIVLRPLSAAFGAVSATAASTVAGALPYLLLAGTVHPASLTKLSAAAWSELLFLAVGSGAIGMLLWNRAVLGGGSASVSRLLYLVPVVSVLGAIPILGEKPSPAMLAGGAFIILGVLITGSQ